MVIKCNKANARALWKAHRAFWITKKGRPAFEGKLIMEQDYTAFSGNFDRLCRSANYTWWSNGDKLNGLDFYRDET